MRVLLYLPNKDVRELLGFQLSSQVKVILREMDSEEDAAGALRKDDAHKQAYEILAAANSEEAANKLSENAEAIDIAIVPGDRTDSVIFGHLKTRKHPVAVIFVYEKSPPDPSRVPGATVLGSVPIQEVVEGVVKLLKSSAEKAVEADGDSEYCPIRTTLLIKAIPLHSDIYIRLSKNKFVKLFHAGMKFTQDDMRKYYETKKVEYMYLRRNQMDEFVTNFRKELMDLVARPSATPAELQETAEVAFEAIHEMIHQLGFTKEIQEVAKAQVAVTLRAVGKNPKLQDLLDGLKAKGDYLARHSTVLAHVGCCIAKEMEWASEATFSKLVIAAMMHDMTLQNHELARINTLTELKERAGEFPPDLVKSYHLHPSKAADLVRSFEEIPADVDAIVLQHHERPGGAGFPRGLTNNYIAPLSAVFIVAHDLVQFMLDRAEKFQLGDFLAQRKTEYSQGNFRKVITALEKMMSAGGAS
ncbi:MAG: hypothetical protein HUU37_11300 [Bdellovibrionales bacterium]|nr:hypothetical protein [Bdellovibrionales bacterium]